MEADVRKLILLPATKRLKQLIKAHGEVWTEVERRPVACLGDEVGVFIRSPDGAHTRWVRETDVSLV